MTEFDLVIRDGTVATAAETSRCDINAAGRYVLPGGIDSHCHSEPLSGIMSAGPFYGGPSVTSTVAHCHERARNRAVIDYGFRLIIGGSTDKILSEELPATIKGGITLFKVCMTYSTWRLEDYQLLLHADDMDRPGIEMRLPILFSEGVLKGRLSTNQFVALGATNHARMCGRYPRNGTIGVGSDADIAIWNPDIEKRVDCSMMHGAVGYSPRKGRVYKGWPERVISCGREREWARTHT